MPHVGEGVSDICGSRIPAYFWQGLYVAGME